MSPAAIVAAISAVSSLIRVKLEDELPSGSVPSENLLKRAIESLLASKAISPDFIQNADLVKMFLENVVMERDSNPDGELTKDVLKKLLRTCLGSPTGKGTLSGVNRDRVPVTSGNIEYKYLILQPMPQLKGGIDDTQFELLVDAAWDRWSDAIPKLTTMQVKQKNKANMLIGFTELDGTGNKLAEASLRLPGTNEYRMQIDVAETWSPSKLLGTLIHELGHILGMEHINSPGSIMDATASKQPSDPLKVKLTQADIDAIPAEWKA